MVEKDEQLRELDAKREDAARREQEETDRLQRLKNEYQRNSSGLTQLRDSARNRLVAYGGSKVPVLLQAINNEPGWRSKPIGPLGTHVKLKDMRWQRVLESVIGNTLNSFFVSNHQDRQRLKKIMDRVGCHSPIIIGADTLFDYSSGEPHADILTILRVIECDNEIVKRQLILSVHVERAALVDKRADGDRLMRTQPYNVQACFSADMFSISGGQAGSLSAALPEHRGAPRLSQNVADAIRNLEAEQQRLDQEIAQCQQALRDLRQEKTAAERQKDVCRRELGEMRRRKDMLRQENVRLDEQMQEAAPGKHLGARRRQARDGDAEGGDHAAVRGDPDTEGRGGRAEGAGASRDPGDRRTQAPVRGADEQPPGASGNGRGGASQADQQPRLLEAEALQHPRGRRGERARGGDSRRGSPLPGGEGQGVLRRGGDAAHDGRDRGGEEAAAAAQEEGGVRGGRE